MDGAPRCACGELATMEHHVVDAHGNERVTSQCPTCHNTAVAALHAVPVDAPERYRMEWTRPHPDA